MKYSIRRHIEVWEEEYPYKRTYRGTEISLPEELELDYDLRVGDKVFGLTISSMNVSPEGQMIVVVNGTRTELVGIERAEWIENFLANNRGWQGCPLQDYITEIKHRTKVSGALLLMSRCGEDWPKDVIKYMRDRGMDTDIFLAPEFILDFHSYLIAVGEAFVKSGRCFRGSPRNYIKYSPLFKIVDAKLRLWEEERKWKARIKGEPILEMGCFGEVMNLG